MDARLDLYSNEVAGQFNKHINSAGAVVTGSTLPAPIQELVKIRARRRKFGANQPCRRVARGDRIH
jgi:hypothetical protein